MLLSDILHKQCDPTSSSESIIRPRGPRKQSCPLLGMNYVHTFLDPSDPEEAADPLKKEPIVSLLLFLSSAWIWRHIYQQKKIQLTFRFLSLLTKSRAKRLSAFISCVFVGRLVLLSFSPQSRLTWKGGYDFP
jgi:hypothetical protein